MLRTASIIGSLGNATDEDVAEGIIYTSDNGVNRVGTGGSRDKSTIIVTAPTGSTVTCSMGDVVKTAMEKDGTWTFKNCDIGTWTITAIHQDKPNPATRTVCIIEDGQMMRYYVTLSYFQATISVIYPAGATCTCTNGSTTLTAKDTSGNCEFIVEADGTWTVSAYGISKTVVITEMSESVSVDLTMVYDRGAFADGFAYSVGTNPSNNEPFTDLSNDEYLGVNVRFGQIYIKPKIDLTPFSTLTAKFRGAARLMVSSTGDEGGGIAETGVVGKTEGTVDISAVNKNAYIAITTYDQTKRGDMYLYSVKLR